MDNNLKIIKYLGKNQEKRYTMHELSRLLAIPYASFYRTVQQMTDLLEVETVGKSKTLQIKKNNPVLKAYLTIAADEERKEFLKKQPILKKITTELNTNEVVLLFGSYAKGTETEKSDIDLLIINKQGKKMISFSKYELLFKKKINALVITPKEFKKMLHDTEENVGKQAVKNHIILNNPESFWELILEQP